jgi:hypothetical protein
VYREALVALAALTDEFARVRELAESICDEQQAVYIEEITPKPPPPPEIIKHSMQTPAPRILLSQEQKSVDSSVLDHYWTSFEGRFAIPAQEEIMTRGPTRDTPAFAMPKQKHVKYDPPPAIENDTLKMIPTPRNSARIYRTEVSRPQTGHSAVECADFGEVPVGKTGYATVPISNSGTKPLHFTIGPPTHPDVRFESLPGIIPVGLKTILRLSVRSEKPQSLRGSFTVRTAEGEMPISIAGTIISPPSE